MRSGAFWTLRLSRMKLTSLFLPSGASARTAIRTPTALGRITLVHLTSQSCQLPGSAQRCLLSRRSKPLAIVRENVLVGPAREVEQGARREEVEACLHQFHPILAGEPLVELFLERVEIADVARGIFALRVAELVGPPVACLLLLGKVDVQEFLDEVLEPVPVGIGPHKARCRAGAVERRGHDPEIGL